MASYSGLSTAQADIGYPENLDWHPKYFKQTYRKNMFTLTLTATTTAVAAGNIVAAAAAASTQFALANPATSAKNLVFTKFFMGIISGTPGPGPIFHGFCTTVPSIASIGGTILNNFFEDTTTSVATPHALAGGSALTGASAVQVFRAANFTSTATAQASPGELNCVEEFDGDIIIPPGCMWVPLWSAAGTSVLNAYSITWYETGL